MRPISRACTAAAALLICSALTACAGSGRAYGCNHDAGTCGGVLPGDGGTVNVGDFISDPVLVWHDNGHDSDADVVAFNGALYTAFRHGTSFAVSSAASLVVASSSDQGQSWHKTAELNLQDLDLREPKLSVFQQQLHLTATAWNPADPNDHHTSVVAAASSDGSAFGKLADTGLFAGSEAWRPKQAGSSLWMTAWKADELYPNDAAGLLSLYASVDGQTFTGGVALPVGPGAHQGELLLRADGSLWIAIPERAESGGTAQQTICHTSFPTPFNFTCWSAPQLPIGGPVLFEFNGLLFVSGEHDLGDGHARTALWQVDEQAQSFDLIADFPQSEGETGEPGVVVLDETHALITYHSTSTLDPRVTALGHEPTTLESVSQAFAVDVLAVTIDLSKVPAGL